MDSVLLERWTLIGINILSMHWTNVYKVCQRKCGEETASCFGCFICSEVMYFRCPTAIASWG